MKAKLFLTGAAAALAFIAFQAGAQAPVHPGPTSDVDSLAGAKHKEQGKAPKARSGSGAPVPEHRGPTSDTDSLSGAKHK